MKKKKKKELKLSNNPVKKQPPVKIPSTARSNYTGLLIILLITFIAYLPALRAGFVNWDDPDYVNNNPLIKDWSNINLLVTKPVQGNYHPLTMLSLALNYAISGMDAWSYHLFNLLFHL